MSQAIRYCVGGRWAGSDSAETIPCVNRYRHGEDCPDRTTEEVKCSGCEPRHATDGYLCGTCHRYLAQWLAAPIKGEPAENSLLFVHSWLKSQVRREGSTAAKEDWQRGGSSDDGQPSVIREAVFDCIRLMEDRVFIGEERLLQSQGVVMADFGAFDFTEGVARLRNAILKIEDDPLLVGELFRKLQDTMITAHGLAPWRATAHVIRGTDGPIPCPHCERKALTLFGGDSWVTCRSCHATIDRGWFDHWSAMLESGRETAGGRTA